MLHFNSIYSIAKPNKVVSKVKVVRKTSGMIDVTLQYLIS